MSFLDVSFCVLSLSGALSAGAFRIALLAVLCETAETREFSLIRSDQDQKIAPPKIMEDEKKPGEKNVTLP